MFQVIIGFLLFLSMCSSHANAQMDNGELYRALWEKELNSFENPLKDISGAALEPFFPDFNQDSNSSWSLLLYNPVLSYRKIGPRSYLRTFNQNYQLEGKGFVSGLVSAEDTLSKKQVKAQLKSKDLVQALKGENPFFFSKYIAPGLWILGSTGTIFAFFYIRSR